MSGFVLTVTPRIQSIRTKMLQRETQGKDTSVERDNKMNEKVDRPIANEKYVVQM